MMGAMFQLLPVLAGSSIYKASFTSIIIHVLYTTGVMFFTLGLGMAEPMIVKLAMFTLIPGILGFLILVSISLYQAKSSQVSIAGMRIAVLSFWITLILGSLLAVGQGWESIPIYRQFTSIHIAWATIGWVTTIIAAIAYQVVPMFQVTNDYPEKIKKLFIPVLFICLISWSVLHYFEYQFAGKYSWLNQLFVLIPGVMLLVFVFITIRLQIQRKKRLADASLYFWITGLSSLSIAVVLFIFSVITQYDLSLLLGIFFLTGFVFSVINGMLYKIVPFLIWLHLNKKLAFTDRGIRGIPTMNEVINRKKMLRQYYIHVLALSFSVLAYFLPSIFFYLAALTWLINWCVLLAHLIQAVWVYNVNLKGTAKAS